jgi:site-specific DNA-methyltransferase (adenine-specific)
MTEYQLYHGDCLAIMPTLGGPVDMILCDLPYGVTSCAWDSVIPFEPLWAQYKRLIKPRGAVVLFGSQPFTSALVMSNAAWFKYEWVWIKNNSTGFSHCANMPLKNHEDIAVFSDGLIQHDHLTTNRMFYNPQGLQPYGKINKRGSKGFSGTMERKSQSNIFQTEFTNYPRTTLFFKGVVSTVHPTQKPVALLEYLIRTYTNESETVLDNTMGSGSTGVAAINTGRKFVGIEMDPHYFAIAEQRIADAARQARGEFRTITDTTTHEDLPLFAGA